MRRAWGWAGVGAAASVLVACSFLKKPGAGDAGEAGAPEAPAVVAADAAAAGPAEAVNASEMTRYPDEKPIDHAPVTAESGGNMRTEAGPGGDLVIVLKRGTEVEKIAEHGDYYLVVADDPKAPARKLMGWIADSAFSGGGAHHEERVDAGHAPASPTTPPSPITPPVPTTPAPAKVVDAGTKPPTPVTPPTPPTPVGPPKPLDVHKTNGTCPAGYGSCGAACRLTCKADAECGLATVHCTSGFCLGLGVTPCK